MPEEDEERASQYHPETSMRGKWCLADNQGQCCHIYDLSES